jgi:phosphatidylglycerophosphate synthase
MSLASWYEKYKTHSIAWRAKYFAVILKLLAKFKITPDQITFFRLLFIVPIIYGFYQRDLLFILIFYVLFWFLDLFDGALARYLKIASDKGRFGDTVVDNFIYAVIIGGFIYLNVAWAWLLGANIFLELLVQTIGIIKKQPQFKSDWYFKAQADLPYFKSASHLILLLYFFGLNLLNSLYSLLNICLLVTIFYLILNKKKC